MSARPSDISRLAYVTITILIWPDELAPVMSPRVSAETRKNPRGLGTTGGPFASQRENVSIRGLPRAGREFRDADDADTTGRPVLMESPSVTHLPS